ncbi:MAG: DinB family protein [Gemmatimonadetes bacterium]|nr:DinB family protein [Gemmatimonadota bacterium]
MLSHRWFQRKSAALVAERTADPHVDAFGGQAREVAFAALHQRLDSRPGQPLPMNPSPLIGHLRRTAEVIPALTAEVDDEQARWRPRPDQWSIIDVVSHLTDEESRDFRTRVDLTLHRPGEVWPAIDPERWVKEERYIERELAAEVERFRLERMHSLDWLRGLNSPDWTRSHQHPSVGTLTAGDLLASWVAHDLIHVRQVTRLHREYLETVVAPGTRIGYAGRW